MSEKNNVIGKIIGTIFSILVLGIVLSLGYFVFTILTNINVDVMAKFIEKSIYNSPLIFILYFVAITIAGGIIGSFLGYYGAYFLASNSKNFVFSIIRTLSDFLSRFPSVLIGLLIYFILIFTIKLPWNLITQIIVFAIMIASPVYDSSSIALKNRTSPKEGIILGLARVWLEFIIMMVVVIFYVSNPSMAILSDENTKSFSDFIAVVCNEGLLLEIKKDFSYIIAIMVTMSIVNSLVNWFYKNYAIRCYKKN